MKSTSDIRIVGKLKASTLIRFGKNQRRAALVSPRSGESAGIKKFRTWKDVEAWRRTHHNAS